MKFNPLAKYLESKKYLEVINSFEVASTKQKSRVTSKHTSIVTPKVLMSTKRKPQNAKIKQLEEEAEAKDEKIKT